jgi:hypothetical protein
MTNINEKAVRVAVGVVFAGMCLIGVYSMYSATTSIGVLIGLIHALFFSLMIWTVCREQFDDFKLQSKMEIENIALQQKNIEIRMAMKAMCQLISNEVEKNYELKESIHYFDRRLECEQVPFIEFKTMLETILASASYEADKVVSK